MADIKLNETFQQIKQLIIEMPLMKKISILTVMGLALGSLGVLAQLSNQSTYEVLFSNLESEDISSITQALDKYGVQYQIQSESKALLVPGEDVLATRLKLAKDGLPQHAGVGYEIFDNQSFGMTDFEQQLNYQRALQGELQRTINEFREIEDSRVHLVIPQKSVFLTEKEPATASIILKLKKGETIDDQAVQSIIHMVSASVKDLDPKHVTVVDTSGQLLSSPVEEGENGSLAGMRKKGDLEVSYENKVKSLLEPIVGFGKVKVKVTADLDFTSKQTTEEKFDPESIAVRTETRTRNKESDEVGSANQQGGQQQGGGMMGQNSNKEKDNVTETVAYEVSKQIQQINHPTGELKSLSVAVVVDGIYSKNQDGISTYNPRSADDMKNFEEIVKGAIGYNSERGDQLKIMNLAFQNPEESFASDQGGYFSNMKSYTFYLNLAVNVVIAVIALLVVLFVIRPVIMAWNQKRQLAGDVAMLNEAEQKLLTPGEARKELEQKAMQDPVDMVQVIRKWLG